MNYLVVNSLDFQRVDFVHFCSDQHRYNSSDVKLCNWQSLVFSLEVSIHDLNPSEIGLGSELVRGGDFNHPVKHSSSEAFVNIMVAQERSVSLDVLFIAFENLFGIELAVLLGVVKSF